MQLYEQCDAKHSTVVVYPLNAACFFVPCRAVLLGAQCADDSSVHMQSCHDWLPINVWECSQVGPLVCVV